MKKYLSLVALILLFTAIPNAQAVVVQSSELIEDTPPFELFDRNLSRTRVDASGTSIVETSDAAIILDNLVDSDFGVTNLEDVTFRHDLTWLIPAPDAFLTARLEIKAFGALGSNDEVSVETIELGSLVNGSFGSGFFSTSVFNSANAVLLNGLFSDGYLNVTVNKNASGGFFSQLNAISVYSSKLTVTYEPVPVPEPASMALLSLGLLGAGFRRRT